MNNRPDAKDIVLQAECKVAHQSPDHLFPWGTRLDNSQNLRFNEKLMDLYSAPGRRILKVLDLGCSGGGFVRSLLDDGCFAIGLEGSDYSCRHKRAEWRTIPEHLFLCDITKDFSVLLTGAPAPRPMQFEVITAWEVIEHVAELDLPTLVGNVRKHLLPEGLWIMSVATDDDVVDGVNRHQTVKPREWWVEFFEKHGFHNLPHVVDYFNTQFVRGPKYGALHSFHLVLSPDPACAPKLWPVSKIERLYDRWLGSRMQRRLARWVVGPRC